MYKLDIYLTKISKILDSYDQISIVDIGFHKGHFVEHFSNLSGISREKLKVTAVDPINYHVDHLYDMFLQYAVSNESSESTFNLYDEPGCNSLLRLKTENLSNNKNNHGWYCAYPISKIGEITVKVVTLDYLIDTYIQSPVIHFLKIDTQGNDINVVKSTSKNLEKVMFVLMESCVAKQDSEIMYVNQTTINDDITYMKNAGFDILHIEDYSHDAPPEANILFYNTRFVRDMLHIAISKI